MMDVPLAKITALMCLKYLIQSCLELTRVSDINSPSFLVRNATGGVHNCCSLKSNSLEPNIPHFLQLQIC